MYEHNTFMPIEHSVCELLVSSLMGYPQSDHFTGDIIKENGQEKPQRYFCPGKSYWPLHLRRPYTISSHRLNAGLADSYSSRFAHMHAQLSVHAFSMGREKDAARHLWWRLISREKKKGLGGLIHPILLSPDLICVGESGGPPPTN